MKVWQLWMFLVVSIVNNDACKLNLYFIALIPNEDLRSEVKALKQEMFSTFGAKHALKSPAHITLQMPFRRDATNEALLCNALEQFAGQEKVFPVQIKGFGCFTPRVIYLRIENHTPICRLHNRLNKVLAHPLNFSEKEIKTKIHPHMTIATRDLTESAFYSAWPSYESRPFESTFDASHIFLLKHNGRFWDIFRSFKFVS